MGGAPIVDDTLTVTGLARQFRVLCDHANGVDINRRVESEVPSDHTILAWHATNHEINLE